jgi:hypothetical protein
MMDDGEPLLGELILRYPTVATPPAFVPLQCSPQPTRCLRAPIPVTPIAVPAIVERNEQALHAAVGAGVGTPTHDTAGVDGVVGPMFPDVIVQFVTRHLGLPEP